MDVFHFVAQLKHSLLPIAFQYSLPLPPQHSLLPFKCSMEHLVGCCPITTTTLNSQHPDPGKGQLRGSPWYLGCLPQKPVQFADGILKILVLGTKTLRGDHKLPSLVNARLELEGEREGSRKGWMGVEGPPKGAKGDPIHSMVKLGL